jgi:photosystem II stability/assembly factor-like uncharacterized protein
MKLTSNFLGSLRIDSDKNWHSYNIYNLGRGNINLGRNQPLSSGLYINDIGKVWNLLPSTPGLASSCYCGNGIVLIGTGDGHIFRSKNYGETWVDSGELIFSTPIESFAYCGSGIVLFGTGGSVAGNKHIWRSTNYGATWTDLGEKTQGRTLAMIYCGNGILLAGDSGGHITKSIDYGATWSDVGKISDSDIRCITYCGSGILCATSTDKHIFRSTDYGATWIDLAIPLDAYIRGMVYCGNGIAVAGTAKTLSHVWRSVDYGATWSDLGIIASEEIISMAYCGNGVILFSTTFSDHHIWRSMDFGASWEDLGDMIPTSWYLLNCNNGIVLAGTTDGTYRNDVSFKLDENAADCGGEGGDMVNPVMFMDFWSDNASSITLEDGELLPDVYVDFLPDLLIEGIKVLKVVAILKYGQKADGSGDSNWITTGSVVCREETAGSFRSAIDFTDSEAWTAGNAVAGGDVHIGYYDISNRDSNIRTKLEADGYCTINSMLDGILTNGDFLYLLDVQIGIRVYFQFAE